MRYCPECQTKKYTKRPSTCPKCNNPMIKVDGRLRKVVESLFKSEYQVAFAYCETYIVSEVCVAEIFIGFEKPYDKFIFEGLPEHFEFECDRYAHQVPYSLNYVLNHIGKPMAMILFSYCGDTTRHTPANKELKKAISELYDWTLGISDRWCVYKLGGYL